MQSAKVLTIYSLQRGLEVLSLVEQGQGLSLHDLHQASRVPKASLLRILKTLGEQGRITRTADGAYTMLAAGRPEGREPPGKDDRALTGFATKAWSALAQEALDGLSHELPWPSDIGVPDQLSMRVIASNRACYGAHWRRSVVGAKVDLLESALGRSYLAFCTPQERLALTEQVLGADKARSRRREAIQKEIDLTRRRGFGSRDAHYPGPDSHHEDRLSAIASPVLVDGVVVACLSCVWDTSRASRSDVIEGCLAHLVRAASHLGAALARRR